MSARKSHRGFSIVELMVAMLLGVILMMGVVSVFTTSKKSYSLNTALGQVQQRGRFALNYLETPIRMAGFFGCAHDVAPVSVLNGTTSGAEAYGTSSGLLGYEYTGTGVGATLNITSDAPTAAASAASWSPNLPADIAAAVGVGGTSGQAIAGSDIVVLHEAVPGGVNLTNPWQDTVNGDSLKINTADAAGVSIGEIVVVTDCSTSRLFQITNISNSGGGITTVDHSGSGSYSPGDDASKKFSYAFKAGSQILNYVTYVFYIGIGQDGGPSLFEASLGTNGFNTAQEMVAGIASMQLLYGVDTDGDQVPNEYLTADNVANWSQVVSVRIGLLTRSDANTTDSKPVSSFTLLDPIAADGLTVKVPTTAGRLREVFNETVSIRNRLP